MNKKIDIYYKGAYICTTTQSKTCKKAKEKFFNNPVYQGLRADNTIGEIKLDNVELDKITARFKK